MIGFLHHAKTYSFIDEKKFSCWRKHVKHLVRVKKAAIWLLTRGIPEKGIKYDDWKYAEYALIRKAQNCGFPEEMQAVIKGEPLPKTSSILSLQPFLDEFGVMRARGRLERASILPLSARIPIIMPQGQPITRLLVRMYHEEYLHQEDGAVITALQPKVLDHQFESCFKKC